VPGIQPEATSSPDFSPRQVEVLKLLSQGQSNKAIGRTLGLSEFTVRGHVS
jgi:DNA-binding NarL/FixJ family response regulator